MLTGPPIQTSMPVRATMLGRAVLVSALVASLTGAIIAAPTPAMAAPVVGCEPSGLPSVAVTAVPWAQQRLDPSAVWSLTRGSGVTVAVVDSGVSTEPAVLRGKFAPGSRDFTAGGDPFCDTAGRGTAVASIIAGRDGTGPFAGVAPDASIVSLRVLSDSDVVAAIRYAIDRHVQVINLSAVAGYSADLQHAINDAVAADIVVVAAAGSSDYSGVLAVTGVDETGRPVDTGSPTSGPHTDVAAPAADIVGPAGHGYVVWNGTGFAAAYVSGVVALLRAYQPDLPARDVATRIAATADHPATGGVGVVNPYRAITASTRSARPAARAPLATETTISVWVAIGGVTLAGLLLAGGPLLRIGRRLARRRSRS